MNNGDLIKYRQPTTLISHITIKTIYTHQNLTSLLWMTTWKLLESLKVKISIINLYFSLYFLMVTISHYLILDSQPKTPAQSSKPGNREGYSD